MSLGVADLWPSDNGESWFSRADEALYTSKREGRNRVTAFNGLGTSVAKHKKKGDLVEVQGRLHYSKWTDREGVERYAVEIVAEEVLFL